jgi:hypothetical protein
MLQVVAVDFGMDKCLRVKKQEEAMWHVFGTVTDGMIWKKSNKVGRFYSLRHSICSFCLKLENLPKFFCQRLIPPTPFL